MRSRQKIINLFNDTSISAVKQIISIGDEEDLNQFWEHIITTQPGSESAACAFFITLYQLSSQFMEHSPETFFEIIVEQSSEAFYFTVWNRRFVRYAQKVWDKRTLDYRTNEKRVTVRLLKRDLEEQTARKSRKEQSRVESLLESAVEEKGEKKLPPYDFIAKEDLGELIELSEDLSEQMFEVDIKGINPDVLTRIRSFVSMVAITLNYYPQIEEVARVMSEFSVLMTQHKEAAAELNRSQIALVAGLIHNFERWLKVLFVEGGAHLHFMNRSLRADVDMIRAMIAPPLSDEAVDLESVFDF